MALSQIASLFRSYGSLMWWGLGFFCLMLPLRAFDAHFFLAGFVVLALGVIGRVLSWSPERSLGVPRSFFLLFLGLFWCVALVSALASEVPFISFIFFCFISILPLSFLFVSLARDPERFFQAAIPIGFVVYAVLCVATIVSYFFFPDLLYHGRTHLPLANPNSLAGFFVLGFFASYGVMLVVQRSLFRAVSFALCCLIICALLTTGSRGGFLSLVIGFGLFNVLSPSLAGQYWRQYLGFLGALGGSFLLVSFLNLTGNPQTALDVVSGTVSGDIQVFQDRPLIWRSAFRIAMDHFWTGTGIGTFFLYYPEYRLADYSTSGLMAHNDPLHFFSEMGVFAPLLFYGVIGAALYKTVCVLPQIKGDISERVRVLIPFCALGALVIHTHITFHFYILPILFLVGVMMAYWFWRVEMLVPSKTWFVTTGKPFENRIVQGCLAALVMCQIFVFVPSQGSELMVRHAKKLIQKDQDLIGFMRWINRAQRVSFHRNGRAMALEATIPSGVLRTRKDLNAKDELSLFQEARGLLDASIIHNSRLASLYYELSVLSEYAHDHLPQEAQTMQSPRDLMARAVTLDPLHANTRKRYAELLEKDGARAQAYDVLKAGLHWHYAQQEPIDYFQKTAKLALEFDDMESREIALQRTLAFLRRQHARRLKLEKMKREALSTKQ